jgi:electron transfer flavoprotein alpha subunit
MAGARVVVGLGRGIKDGIRMGEVMDMARMLGAAVGGTRPVVDAGLLPRQQQIGLTGYSISPDVYFALGISGRDNHVVGIRYAKKVVAVNNSRDAPIFRYADYGIVSDMFDFISRYRMHLSEARSR